MEGLLHIEAMLNEIVKKIRGFVVEYDILSKCIMFDLGFSIRSTGVVIFSESILRQKKIGIVMRPTVFSLGTLSLCWPPGGAVDLLIIIQLRRKPSSYLYEVSYFP